jgi:hypothetical protein
VKGVRNSTAQFRWAFCSTDGPAYYDSAHTSSYLNYKNFPSILGYLRLPFECFGVINYIFVLHQCVVASIGPSQSLTDIRCTPEIKETPASVQGV